MRVLPVVALPALLFCAACGGTNSPQCAVTGFTVTPSSAVADHTAAPPENSIKFVSQLVYQPGCNQNGERKDAMWSVSGDAATVSNKHGVTYGVVTCLQAASEPITVSAELDATSLGQIADVNTLQYMDEGNCGSGYESQGDDTSYTCPFNIEATASLTCK